MNTYVVTYNGIDGKNGLFDAYENIEGENPTDALKKRFKKPLKRVYGDDIDHADVIIQQGKFDPEKNRIHFWDKGASFGYKRIR